MGSLALSLCHLAAGRVDAVCCLKPARSIDIAAAQLLVRERGLAIELFEDPPFGAAPLDLGQRSRVVAAATPELCVAVAHALRLTPGACVQHGPIARTRERQISMTFAPGLSASAPASEALENCPPTLPSAQRLRPGYAGRR